MAAGARASKGMLDDLVHQFTDPYACYRELIQNSIDAGSSRIDVTLGFSPTAERGTLTARVQDWGEGMNREVIEEHLLTKFRSSKENDLTKIGKFGIGFVSVFALKPDAVTVDTGRDGESWRVLFKRDRSYELLKLDSPAEGTAVTLHIAATAGGYDEHVAKARQSLSRWCRHSEVEVWFSSGGADGTPAGAPVSLKEPLTVDAPFQLEHREEALHLVLGPSRNLPATSGFYNRGLTLLETDEPLLPGVALKVFSPLLEHTLTRDNVQRDEAFERAMSAARRLCARQLLEVLPDELRKAAQRVDGKDDWRTLFRFARTRLPKKALWLRAPGGGAHPASAVDTTLVLSAQANGLTERLHSAGVVVVEANLSEQFAETLSATFGLPAVDAGLGFTLAQKTSVPQPDGFASTLAGLLDAARCPVAGVALAPLQGASSDAPWSFIEAVGRPIRAEQASKPLLRRKNKLLLCLNLANDSVQSSKPLMFSAPRLAALLWARRLLVHHALMDAKTDAALTGAALK